MPTDLDVPVAFFPKRDEAEHRRAALDTVLIEPDRGLLCLVWRCTRPSSETCHSQRWRSCFT